MYSILLILLLLRKHNFHLVEFSRNSVQGQASVKQGLIPDQNFFKIWRDLTAPLRCVNFYHIYDAAQKLTQRRGTQDLMIYDLITELRGLLVSSQFIFMVKALNCEEAKTIRIRSAWLLKAAGMSPTEKWPQHEEIFKALKDLSRRRSWRTKIVTKS
jgi:hypothetical protein